jgi:hypothetical protein
MPIEVRFGGLAGFRIKLSWHGWAGLMVRVNN